MKVSEHEWKAATARQFDERAAMWRTHGVPEGEQLEQVTSRLGAPPGSLVLDAGCGSANWTAALARHGYRVRGFDISPAMIAQGQAQLRDLGISEAVAHVEVGDVERMPFPDETFDAAVCFRVLDFTPSPGVALTEFARVLRPGGRLVLSMLGALSPIKREWWRRFLPDYQGDTIGNNILPWELETLLTTLGWRLLEQFGEYGAMGGGENPSSKVARRLSDQRLRQAGASSWWFVVARPSGAGER